MRYDQSIRSWIFATLSPKVLVHVHDFPTSFHLWECVNNRFLHSSMARALELKRMLTTVRESDYQSMDDYLRHIKNIADNIAVVNSPVPQSDLVHFALLGLGRDYETLVTTLTYVPMNLTFDDLQPRLLLHEQCLQTLKEMEDQRITHRALAISYSSSGTPTSAPSSNNR